MMRLKEKQRLDHAVKVMKTLNKMQKQTKELRKNLDKNNQVVEEYNIKELEKTIFQCSLMPVDVIGDTVYLDFLKKNKIKPMAEPNQFGWYHVQKPKPVPRKEMK